MPRNGERSKPHRGSVAARVGFVLTRCCGNLPEALSGLPSSPVLRPKSNETRPPGSPPRSLAAIESRSAHDKPTSQTDLRDEGVTRSLGGGIHRLPWQRADRGYLLRSTGASTRWPGPALGSCGEAQENSAAV